MNHSIFVLLCVTAYLTINIFLSFTVIFLERKAPSSIYAWLLFIWVFPVVGFIFYILFSQKFYSNKVYRFNKKENRRDGQEIQEQKKEIRSSPAQAADEFGPYMDNIEFHLNVSDALYTDNNEVELITDGKDFFESLLRDIENAKKSINLEYYIIKNDMISNKVISLLEKKAEEGLEIRVIYDELGGNRIGQKNLKKLRSKGVKIGAFLPSKLNFISKYIQLRVNYRDHRKITVIDGETAYIGGFNIGDEYLGLDKKMGHWRDTSVRITGNAARELQWRFLQDWTTTGIEEIDLGNTEELEYLFPDTDRIRGNTGIQIVASGPDTINQSIKQGYLKMINDAKEKIRISSPYFVLDSSVEEALKIALNSGVEVEILIPDRKDHIFIYPTTLYYVGRLIEYGAKVYKYKPGFMHSKVLTVDDTLSAVGSCNFDIRSFALNFECSAFIYDKRISEELNRAFDQDVKNSEHYTVEKYNKRSRKLRVKESLSRLLSPLL